MPSTLNEKVEAATKLVKLFHTERIIFYIISTTSVLILILIALYSFLTNRMTSDVFLALFAPAGGISIACGAILKMFSDCLKFIQSENI